MNLPQRPRRLRRTAALRDLVRETAVHATDLVQPLFVLPAGQEIEAIPSLPGQNRWPLHRLGEEVSRLWQLGLRGVALFPVIPRAAKTPNGEAALDPEGLAPQALRAARTACPEMTLFADVALDPYTTHGHDGVLTPDGQAVDNDRSVAQLVEQAKVLAAAGADFVAPSDMMDGRVAAIRAGLDAVGYQNTAIMAYAAKFASAYYGPFREALGSAQAAGTPLLDKATYQLDPANLREAAREVALDLAEGADMVMVKPGGLYLDIIARAARESDRPVSAYQVSGEYAQIHAAAALGWLDLKRCRDESLLALKRAGADVIFTYFAAEFAAGTVSTPARVGGDPLPAYDVGGGI